MADCEQWMVSARANCSDCDWFVEAKNAMGVAAQHADREGHEVDLDLVYGGKARPESANGE